MFNPIGTFKMFWDSIHIIVCLFLLFYVPLELISNKRFANIFPYFLPFQTVILIFLILDIIIKFNTGLYHNAEIIMTHYEVIKIYLKKNFLYDLLPLVIFYDVYDFDRENINPVNILVILKIITLFKMIAKFE